jgi:uncharacterized alkaline shock family protein YloU
MSNDPSAAASSPTATGATTPPESASSAPSTSLASLETGHGRTQIADAVVSKIAGLATREVPGVHALGGGAARAYGAVRERIPGASSNVSQGVRVEVGEKQAAVDLDIVVEYGTAVPDLARAIRRNVTGALESMTGLEVVEVNIAVDDVHIPGDDGGAPPTGPPRVA